MTLLMYEDLAKCPPSLQELADAGARGKLASRVNHTILKIQGYSAEVKLAFYWQMLIYAQKEAS